MNVTLKIVSVPMRVSGFANVTVYCVVGVVIFGIDMLFQLIPFVAKVADCGVKLFAPKLRVLPVLIIVPAV